LSRQFVCAFLFMSSIPLFLFRDLISLNQLRPIRRSSFFCSAQTRSDLINFLIQFLGFRNRIPFVSPLLASIAAWPSAPWTSIMFCLHSFPPPRRLGTLGFTLYCVFCLELTRYLPFAALSLVRLPRDVVSFSGVGSFLGRIPSPSLLLTLLIQCGQSKFSSGAVANLHSSGVIRAPFFPQLPRTLFEDSGAVLMYVDQG